MKRWWSENRDHGLKLLAARRHRLPRYAIEWQRQNKTKVQDYRRRFSYGLPPGRYAELLAEQGGVCAICRMPPAGKKNFAVLGVDHNHQTGKVRGLLCLPCNIRVGQVERAWLKPEHRLFNVTLDYIRSRA